jgi:hypothetical protein
MYTKKQSSLIAVVYSGGRWKIAEVGVWGVRISLPDGVNFCNYTGMLPKRPTSSTSKILVGLGSWPALYT